MRTLNSRTRAFARTLALALGMLLAAAAPANPAQTHIAVHPAVRLELSFEQAQAIAKGDTPMSLALASVASLTGIDAQRLGEVVVIDDLRPVLRSGASSHSISVEQIRSALDAINVNWGRVSISGSTARINLPTAPQQSRTPQQSQRAEPRFPQPIDVTGPATIRTAIASRIATMLGVDATGLRLLFDDADSTILDEPIGAAPRRVDLQPAGSPGSARLPVLVFVYEGDRLVLSRTISTLVEVRRTVATATCVIERGSPIASHQFEVADRWVSPARKPAADPEQIIGSVANLRLAPGQTINSSDIAAPIVCKRGDIVYVHALSGGITVKAKARALGGARDGELVQLRLDGSDRTFEARMAGRGRAVLVVGAGDRLAQDAVDSPGASSSARTRELAP